jgi:Type III secretion system lipoprotein chaperone (YscW)
MKTTIKNPNARLPGLFGALLAFLLVQAVPGAAQVKGTATYRERIALTPDALFEATLEDVSKTDVPAVVVGSVRIDKPGQVPIRFEIPYDLARIDQTHSYWVRARILVASGCCSPRTRFIRCSPAGMLTRFKKAQTRGPGCLYPGGSRQLAIHFARRNNDSQSTKDF